MRSSEQLLHDQSVETRRLARRCAWLLILLASAMGTVCLHATPLHVGTTVSDVPANSLGMSSITRAVGAAPDGTIYVGFFSADGKQLRVASSTDRGATFAASVLVDTAGGSAIFSTASLEVNSAGQVLIAYIDSSSNVFFARSTNAGASYTRVPGLGTASASFQGVRVASQDDHVYVGFATNGGVGVVSSTNAGVSFGSLVPVTIVGGNFALLVDRSNADLVVAAENVSLYLRVSHDHGATFDAQQQPSGQVFFANWTISSDVSGRHVWVAGSLAASDNAYQIDLSDFSSIQRTAFLHTSTASSRSLYAAGCGDIVDSVASKLAVVHDFGASIGTTYTVGGSNQTTSVNPFSGDVLVAYLNATDIKLDVYANETTGCGPHVTTTMDDGHEFARTGRSLNYLVTVSDEFTSADNLTVNLSTPGSALDLANASWECTGSGSTAICPVSSGTGPSLGVVSLPALTTMTWIVSVPVLATATDDSIKLDLDATGAPTVSDIDTLVIFRSGFDVSNSDGTK
jgi:hypothetical protein